MKMTTMLIVLILMLGSLTSSANDAKTGNKSKTVALSLGGVAGFGLGHLYAQNAWSWKSTGFFVADAALITSGILLSKEIRQRKNPSFLYLSLIGISALFLGERIYQATDAASMTTSGAALALRQTEPFETFSSDDPSRFELQILRLSFSTK